VSLGRYALVVVAVVGGALGLAWPLLARGLDRPARTAIAMGAALAAANTLVAHFLALWSRERSATVFLGAVLGGMLGRMAVVLGAVVALVLLAGLPAVPLALSLLAFFSVFLVIELTLVHRQTSAPAGAR
jgi:hypothetical protein